jgi:hypothetical protein
VFTAEAKALYDNGIYQRIDALSGASGKASKLLSRATTNLRKVAVILAAINGESKVSVGALKAAEAWIDYSEASANTIAATAADRRRYTRLKADAAAILTALQALGADIEPVPGREARRKAHLDDRRFHAAIRFLLGRPPAPIEIVEKEWRSGNGTSRKRISLRLLPAPQQSKEAREEEDERI